jgi:hypothetical protein
MNDPERIIHGHSGDLATALMRSVRRDAPSPHARAAALSAIGIGAAALPAATSAAAAAGKAIGVTALGVVKSIAIGAGTAVVVLGVAHRMSNPPPPPPALVEPAAKVAVAAPPVRPLPPAPPTMVVTEPVVVQPTAVKAAPAQPAAEPLRAESSLADEVAALDEARAAARGHDAVGALALLDAYQRDFPAGVLAVEASVLRVEALAQSGQTDRALALGRALLQRSPSGPHADRIRSIVSAMEAAKGEGTIE